MTMHQDMMKTFGCCETPVVEELCSNPHPRTGCREAGGDAAGAEGNVGGNPRLLGVVGGLVLLLPDLWQWGSGAEPTLPARLLPALVQESQRPLAPARPRHFSSAAFCRRQPWRAGRGEAQPTWWTQVLQHQVEATVELVEFYK